MARALALAKESLNLTSPNPRVGCVLVSSDGRVIGEGRTQRAGGPHAEVMALRDAQARGEHVSGATAYVTLEPCSHQGRTGPCCEALILAGVRKVVASLEDPNPQVSGQGLKRLSVAGIDVETGDGAHESRELNIGFFSRMIRHRPWVRMKVAASIDGKTALPDGQSQWITSDAARADGQAWRARSCAVLTGIGTVHEDNPRLNVRSLQTERQPHVVVVDSHLRVALDAHIFIAGRASYIYVSSTNHEKQRALETQGVTVISMPGMDGKVDLNGLVTDLARREINELHVEAGATLNGALIAAGCVDEVVAYIAPKFIGQGRDMASFGPMLCLDEAPQFDFLSFESLGPDLRIVARARGHDNF
jgi:diaminohydroxyphosphoribosylaminopyrimidine deaminase/5-amino-6-(5-phosphoribosylamino)uracil reductase